MMYFCKVTCKVPTSPASPSASSIFCLYHSWDSRNGAPFPPQSTQHINGEDEEFMMIHFHLIIVIIILYRNLTVVCLLESSNEYLINLQQTLYETFFGHHPISIHCIEHPIQDLYWSDNLSLHRHNVNDP